MIHRGRLVLTATMDEIKDTHRRVTLRFREPVERPPTLVGALSYAGQGAEWTYICNGASQQLKRAAEAIGATVVDDSALSLDEIFVTQVTD